MKIDYAKEYKVDRSFINSSLIALKRVITDAKGLNCLTIEAIEKLHNYLLCKSLHADARTVYSLIVDSQKRGNMQGYEEFKNTYDELKRRAEELEKLL